MSLERRMHELIRQRTGSGDGFFQAEPEDLPGFAGVKLSFISVLDPENKTGIKDGVYIFVNVQTSELEGNEKMLIALIQCAGKRVLERSIPFPGFLDITRGLSMNFSRYQFRVGDKDYPLLELSPYQHDPGYDRKDANN